VKGKISMKDLKDMLITYGEPLDESECRELFRDFESVDAVTVNDIISKIYS